jgi:hypothetical protein
MWAYAPGNSYPYDKPVKEKLLHFSDIFLDDVGPFQQPYVHLEKTITKLREILLMTVPLSIW